MPEKLIKVANVIGFEIDCVLLGSLCLLLSEFGWLLQHTQMLLKFLKISVLYHILFLFIVENTKITFLYICYDQSDYVITFELKKSKR